MKKSGTPLELVLEMYAYYQEGHTLVEVGGRFYYSDGTVQYHFRKHGLPRRPARNRTSAKRDAETKRMYADYEAGMSLREVAAKYGYTAPTVSLRFRRAGLLCHLAGKPSWKTV